MSPCIICFKKSASRTYSCEQFNSSSSVSISKITQKHLQVPNKHRKTRRSRRGGTRGPRKQYKEEPDWEPQWDGDGNLVPGGGAAGYDLTDDFIDDAVARDDSDSDNELGPGDSSSLKCSRCGKGYRYARKGSGHKMWVGEPEPRYPVGRPVIR